MQVEHSKRGRVVKAPRSGRGSKERRFESCRLHFLFFPPHFRISLVVDFELPVDLGFLLNPTARFHFNLECRMQMLEVTRPAALWRSLLRPSRPAARNGSRAQRMLCGSASGSLKRAQGMVWKITSSSQVNISST
jgi:hypothetical protein